MLNSNIETFIGCDKPYEEADIVILKYPSYRFLPYHTGVNIVEKVIKNGKLVCENK